VNARNLPASRRESLEDLVYRATLAEGDRRIRNGNPWLTIPITLALAGLMGGLALVLGRRTASRTEPRTVGVLLQEGPEAPAHAPAAAPAPRAQPAPAPAPAPAPEVQPKEPVPPPPAMAEAAPEEAPRALPMEDQSRRYGSSAVPSGIPGATGQGGGEGAAGTGTGSGTGTGGHRPGRIVDLDISQVKEKYRPDLPVYPPMAKMARIQGTVVVQILVGGDGVPISARALQGPYPLRATGEAYAMGWRFEPHLENGVALVSRFNLSVTFKLLN
jgi:protein TonB